MITVPLWQALILMVIAGWIGFVFGWVPWSTRHQQLKLALSSLARKWMKRHQAGDSYIFDICASELLIALEDSKK